MYFAIMLSCAIFAGSDKESCDIRVKSLPVASKYECQSLAVLHQRWWQEAQLPDVLQFTDSKIHCEGWYDDARKFAEDIRTELASKGRNPTLHPSE